MPVAQLSTLGHLDLMQISSRDFHAAVAIGSCFLLFGAAAGLGAFFLFRRSYREVKNWKTTSGTVVGDKVISDPRTQLPQYYPTFQFVADNGQRVTSVASVGSSGRRYRVGASVRVLYSPDDPEKAQLNSFTDLMLMPIFLGVFGLAFSGVGIYIFIRLTIDCLIK